MRYDILQLPVKSGKLLIMENVDAETVSNLSKVFKTFHFLCCLCMGTS